MDSSKQNEVAIKELLDKSQISGKRQSILLPEIGKEESKKLKDFYESTRVDQTESSVQLEEAEARAVE